MSIVYIYETNNHFLHELCWIVRQDVSSNPIDQRSQLSTSRRHNNGMRLQRVVYWRCLSTYFRSKAREFIGHLCVPVRGEKFRSSKHTGWDSWREGRRFLRGSTLTVPISVFLEEDFLFRMRSATWICPTNIYIYIYIFFSCFLISLFDQTRRASRCFIFALLIKFETTSAISSL